jgi:hypothetical protein
VAVRWLPSILILALIACGSSPQVHPAPAVGQTKSSGRIRLGVEHCGAMIQAARPVYPKDAKKAHIEGVVELDILIQKPERLARFTSFPATPL